MAVALATVKSQKAKLRWGRVLPKKSKPLDILAVAKAARERKRRASENAAVLGAGLIDTEETVHKGAILPEREVVWEGAMVFISALVMWSVAGALRRRFYSLRSAACRGSPRPHRVAA